MRRFASYGPLDTRLNYYAPRTALIDSICAQLLGDDPTQDGQYVTIWAPRQSGKTWLMQEVLFKLRREQRHFAVVKLNLQDLEDQKAEGVYRGIITKIGRELDLKLPVPSTQLEFAECFSDLVLEKPLILILDEFDSLAESAIRGVVGTFRNIYIQRRQQSDRTTEAKQYLLHGVALMGVRSVLGVDNVSGSPFNVQRSVHIPNLTADEVAGLFHWYEAESGQAVEAAVIDRLHYEMQGQPGLTCWMGELLTETYNRKQGAITVDDFEAVYSAALSHLPNNNILNIVSKAKLPPYKNTVLDLFQTDQKVEFSYDDAILNYLYTNGVIEKEQVNSCELYARFASPFVQKRLFNFFARDLFPRLTVLHSPFDDLSDTIQDTGLRIPSLMRRYEIYLRENRTLLFREVPRRKSDERIYEAVYHFSLYMFLTQFLASYEGQVIPEFPTGNGKIDLFVRYAGITYGLEIKSFLNQRQYEAALQHAAHYGHQLGLPEMWLVLFVEAVDEENRRKYEVDLVDSTTGVIVHPLLVATGN